MVYAANCSPDTCPYGERCLYRKAYQKECNDADEACNKMLLLASLFILIIIGLTIEKLFY